MDTARYLREVVTFLARIIGVRSYLDHDRLARTADYLSGQFSSFGLSVKRQSFLFRGHAYENVIAELSGTSQPERVLIVGAHYDTVQTSPGADDNASGVAGLLGIARALSGKKPGGTVRFVAFALEEPPVYRTGDMGSYHYAKSLHEDREPVEGMICLEMLGYYCDTKGCQQYPLPFFSLTFPTTGNYIALVGNMRSRRFTERIAAAFRRAVDLPIVTLNAPPVVVGIDFSDHWSFNQFKYNALMVTDTAFYRNPHYHTPTDVPETLDYDCMEQVVQGLAAAITEWGMDRLPVRRR